VSSSDCAMLEALNAAREGVPIAHLRLPQMQRDNEFELFSGSSADLAMRAQSILVRTPIATSRQLACENADGTSLRPSWIRRYVVRAWR